MVRGSFKSGRFKKVQRKLPGGRTTTHYKETRPNQARCGETGEKLHGIPRFSRTEAKNASKTSKRPERPYGGALSSKAMRRKMTEKAQSLAKEGDAPLYAPGCLYLKLAGRDAGKRCVIIKVEGTSALIDGETRRRKCALKHLEPLGEQLSIKEGAAHADVVVAFKKLGVELRESKPKKAAARPKKVRKAKVKPAPEEKAVKPKAAATQKAVSSAPKAKATPAEKKPVATAPVKEAPKASAKLKTE